MHATLIGTCTIILLLWAGFALLRTLKSLRFGFEAEVWKGNIYMRVQIFENWANPTPLIFSIGSSVRAARWWWFWKFLRSCKNLNPHSVFLRWYLWIGMKKLWNSEKGATGVSTNLSSWEILSSKEWIKRVKITKKLCHGCLTEHLKSDPGKPFLQEDWNWSSSTVS